MTEIGLSEEPVFGRPSPVHPSARSAHPTHGSRTRAAVPDIHQRVARGVYVQTTYNQGIQGGIYRVYLPREAYNQGIPTQEAYIQGYTHPGRYIYRDIPTLGGIYTPREVY